MIEQEKKVCSSCGQTLEEHEGTTVGGDLLCDDCCDAQCVRCDHCGEYVYRVDTVSDGHITLCTECRDNHYNCCTECDRIIHNEDTHWDRNDDPYCDRCYCEEEEIEEYNYKPDPVFYGTDTRYLGVELEVDCGGRDDDNALAIKNIANCHGEHIYIKSDGSLNNGFEIVTHPMTLNYHIDKMLWHDVLASAIRMGYKSHQTSTCGLHIHVNRSSLGSSEKEQEDTISKILFFVEKHWNEVFTFSRRREYDINRWAARYGFEKTGKEILDKAKTGSLGRYTAVNLCNYKTIEFRIFRGTLKYNTLLAALQFVDEICNVAFSMSENELDKQSWTEFVMGIKHTELIQYLKERQLYVNEEICAEEEM